MTAKDIDLNARLTTSVEMLGSSEGFKLSDCTNCFETWSVGQGGKDYVPESEFGSKYRFAGLAKWVWHY